MKNMAIAMPTIASLHDIRIQLNSLKKYNNENKFHSLSKGDA